MVENVASTERPAIFLSRPGSQTCPQSAHYKLSSRSDIHELALQSLRENSKKKPQVSPLRYALSKNISTKGPRNCRSLGFARDDKGKGDGSMESGCGTEGVFHHLGWVAGP
jgi:hypothetical protein